MSDRKLSDEKKKKKKPNKDLMSYLILITDFHTLVYIITTHYSFDVLNMNINK